MSGLERNWDGQDELHAYYDGELGGFARWRFERHLRRSSELQRELAALRRIGELVGQNEEQAGAPDLWDRIQLRLPAIDAQRAEREAPATSLVPGGWLRPLGAVAAAAIAVVAVMSGVFDSSNPTAGVVRWMDSGGRAVLVLEGDVGSKTTIIWVLDEATSEGAGTGGTRDVA